VSGQVWVVRSRSGEEFDVDGVSDIRAYGGYVHFLDKDRNTQGAFSDPEYYYRVSNLEDEWE